MTQSQRLDFLIGYLAPQIKIPDNIGEKHRLFRALVNVREPKPIGEDFLRVQNEYLQNEIRARGITELSSLAPVKENIYLWKGDITTLKADAIVNAANRGMTGCYRPLHGCIDNAIHTYAGVQLRNECAEIMKKQGFPEPAGQAKITGAYNLPCKHIIHTVGPVVSGELTQAHRKALADCYNSCLALACEKGLESVAFCCISTGEFHFPKKEAAEIAVNTVEEFLKAHSGIKVIFNVFTQEDFEIYRKVTELRRSD